MEPLSDGEGQWEVVTAKPVNRGDADDGATEDVVARGPEEECRRVFADTVAVAAAEAISTWCCDQGAKTSTPGRR
jgi:hypothetical protein